jgi:LDH2 family malate/lactate/ureidoglycolate dehydrogenase
MAIQIENFVSLEEFKKTTGQILRDLRNSRKAPGSEKIYTAGEKEFENSKTTMVKGIPIVPDLQKEIKELQKELKLDQYTFDF